MKKYIFLILVAVGALFLVQYYVDKTSAEMVTFQIKPTRCRPISLSENVDVVRSGSTGRGCTFSITLTAKGEWVNTGGYYDTPPYAWGGDHFYTINEKAGYIDPDTGLPDNTVRNRDYSFTCSNPTYSIGSLPSYITLTSTENVSGSGTDIAPGKKYTFQVASNAPTNTSFNIGTSYQATCNMISQQDGQLQPVIETNSASQNPGCEDRTSPININPRGTSNNYSVTISSTSCGSPTATPTPTDYPKCPPDVDSGWAECRYGQSTYNLSSCRSKAENYKGVSGPSGGTDRDWYGWAISAPKPLSCGTTCGVAPSYCIVTNTPTPTRTPTPVGPTSTPTRTPTPTTPAACMKTCNGNEDCSSGYTCYGTSNNTNICVLSTANIASCTNNPNSTVCCTPYTPTATPTPTIMVPAACGSSCTVHPGNSLLDCGTNDLTCTGSVSNGHCAILNSGAIANCTMNPSYANCCTPIAQPTSPPAATPTPFHLGCSATSCVSFPGAGSNTCFQAGRSCTQGLSTVCPSTCGSSTISQTCVCAGPCCPGSCSNGLTCGQTSTVTCCNSSAPVSPTNLSVKQPDGGTTIHTRFVTISWNFPSGGTGCGTPWGFNCSGNSTGFSLKIYNSSNLTTPIINKTNLSGSTTSYTTTASDGPLTSNTSYYVEVCATNYTSTCINTTFNKTAYPVGVVTGNIGEYDAQSSTPFTTNGSSGTSVAFTYTPGASSGISTSCSKSTGGTPPVNLSYSCNITLDNVNNDPDPTQNFTLGAVGYNNVLYSGICFQNGGNCITPTTIGMDFDLNGGSNTNINMPVYFSINSGLTYYKIKNGSLQTHNSASSAPLFPVSTLLFDNTGDDYNTTGNYVIIGDNAASHNGTGLVLFNNAIPLGGALASEKSVPPYPPGKNWTSEGYTPITTFNSQRFLEYVRTRKEYQTINNLNQLSSEKINVWNSGSLTITNTADFNNKNIVLIVDGTITLAVNTFIPTAASTALIADTINFTGSGQTVSEAHGIFVANTLNLGSSTQPLKVVGNLSSTQNSVSLQRIRTDNRKPSLFIVFDIDPYVTMLSQLSTALYEWKQLQ